MSDANELREFMELAGSSAVSRNGLPSQGDYPEEFTPEGNGSSTPIHPKMWAVYGNKFIACEKAIDKLNPGEYLIEHNPDQGIYFSQKETKFDELLILPDTKSEEVVTSIKHFWTREEHYRKFKFLWKRGIILWGPPGSGKTSTVQLIVKTIVDLGGIAVYVQNPKLAIKGLEIMRGIEPKRPVLIVLEDLDAIVDNYNEADILALLDGEFQVDNAVFLATTNYPERLDKRIINRPSRFDIVKYIGMPSNEARRFYLSAKNPRLKDKEEELAKWVKDSDGYSIAHLKELIASVECLEIPYQEVVERLDSMMNKKISSTQHPDSKGFGFVA